MIQYRDTGAAGAVCPGQWFDDNLVDGITAFRGQFGFFSFGALRKYAAVLRNVAVAGNPVNLVLGSNTTDPLAVEDARAVLDIVAGGANSHLTVVALSSALFHPKVAHIVRQNRTATAIVGSANLTELALGRHVEAWIELETGGGSNRALDDIVAAIDRWHRATEPGVFQIADQGALDQLVVQGILVARATKRSQRALATRARPASTGRGTRPARWRPPPGTGTAEIEGEAELEPIEAAPATPARGGIIRRWSKKLSASDVNKNAKNIRNLMSLTKAKLVDDLDYFRTDFFDDASWQAATISGNPAEIARLGFEVKLPGKRPRRETLEVVHAPHRESGQHNYHTSIRWGPLAGELRRKPGAGYTGHWAILEKFDTGDYGLTITPDEPARKFIG